MFETVTIMSTLTIGLFTGSLLTEAMILVPYWKRMPPTEFIKLHHTLGPNLFRYFAPLTTIAVSLSVITAVFDKGQTAAWLVTAILCLLTLAIFFTYFKKANAGFESGSISESQLSEELERWASWHWFRTSLMLAAFCLSIIGHI